MDDALADGRYDAFVVWADTRDDGRVALDLTMTSGAHKGEMVTVLMAVASADQRALEFIGLPCVLDVERGEPRVRF